MEYGCNECVADDDASDAARGSALMRVPPLSADRSAVRRFPPDPLGEDRLDDPRRSLTDREIARVVFVAAETGHRFGREGRDEDPAAWMFAPRHLFEGDAPVDACATRHGFVAAMVLHGVWPDLDAEPAVIEHLLDDDVVDDMEVAKAAAPLFTSLYTTFVVSDAVDGVRRAFYATTAVDIDEARAKLRRRVGHTAADVAELHAGFDAQDPRATSLLPSALRDLLGRFNRPEPLPASSFELLVDCRVAA